MSNPNPSPSPNPNPNPNPNCLDTARVQVGALLDAVAVDLGEQPALVHEGEAVAQPPLERGAPRQQHEGVRTWMHGRYGEMWGDVGGYGEMRASSPPPCGSILGLQPGYIVGLPAAQVGLQGAVGGRAHPRRGAIRR